MEGPRIRSEKSTGEPRLLIPFILVLGTVLAVAQYASGRSLWLDEGYLALNILHRTHAGLLLPLDMKQVAPILFLQIERTIAPLFGYGPFGLRLFPLLCGLAALFLFHRVLRRVFTDPYTIALALLLFVFNGNWIYFSSEVKQYMCDLLMYLVLLYVALGRPADERSWYRALGVAGAVAIPLSNVSPIILCTVGSYALLRIVRERLRWAPFLLNTALPWAAVFGVYYFLFIHGHPQRDELIVEWSRYDAFLPLDPFAKPFYRFLLDQYRLIAFSLFDNGWLVGTLLSVLVAVGVVRLVRRGDLGMLVLCAMPLALHLFLSGLKLYPFALRFVLYTVPGIILLAAHGAEGSLLRSRAWLDRGRAWWLLVPALLAALFLWRNEFPFVRHQITESMAYVRAHERPGDRIFVNYFARIPFTYYRETTGWPAADAPVEIGERVVFWNGERWAADTAAYGAQLDGTTGRTWFLSIDLADERDKKKYLQAYMARKGAPLLEELHVRGSDAYLYAVGASPMDTAAAH